MNKKMFTGVGLLLILSSLISCVATKATTRSVKTANVVNISLQAPIVAELDVKATKVAGTATFSTIVNVEDAKVLALKDAVSKAKCDVLIEPVYEFFYTNGVITKIEVIGYPANYKEFRPIKEEDTYWFKKMF